MVTIKTFYQFSFGQQADLLQNKGLFLLSRTEGPFIVDLYELDDLLIEIYYRQEDSEPVSVTASNTSERLKKIHPGNLAPRLRLRPEMPYRKGNCAA